MTLRPFGAERNLDRVVEDLDAAQQSRARIGGEFYVFGRLMFVSSELRSGGGGVQAAFFFVATDALRARP